MAVRTSYYVIPCPCGKEVHANETEVPCPVCGRILVVQGWGKLPREREEAA